MERTEKTQKTVLALGYFDSVHIGHRAVISEALRLAEKLGASAAAVTFSGNLKRALNKGDGKQVYRFFEREKLIKSLGAGVIALPTDKEFLSLSRRAFLDYLFNLTSVCGLVCGKDYRFGYKGEGDAAFLKSYAEEKGAALVIKGDCMDGDRKVSTTYVKELLKDGKIKDANRLLGEPYFISGEVKRGRGEGNVFGVPTANTDIDKDKTPVKEGVYKGFAEVDGKKYPALINYGKKPTFGDDTPSAETFIDGFSGDIYGKTITVYFTDFLREIKKFSSKEELYNRINEDRKLLKTVESQAEDKE